MLYAQNVAKCLFKYLGNLTEGGLAAMKFTEVCNDCGGVVILETNPS